MFILAGVIHICGVIFYAIFASGELQEWSEPPKDFDAMALQQTQMMGPGQAALPATGEVDMTTAGYQNTDPAYPTWDDQQAANPNNPFQSGANYGATDPNAAWNNQNGTNYGNGSSYGAVDNSGASFYETRAQYVQPGSNY